MEHHYFFNKKILIFKGQMVLVDEHLGKITIALGDIEQNLNNTQTAEKRILEKLKEQEEGKKFIAEKFINRVVKESEALMKSCGSYQSHTTGFKDKSIK